jgi:signal transduction histidine kinase
MRKNLILVLFAIWATTTIAQPLDDSRVKVALIYNFAQNIEWKNDKQIETFRFGVIATDTTTFHNFKLLATRYKLKGRTIEPVLLDITSSLKDINLLYIDDIFSNTIADVYERIKGQNILLISDRSSSRLFIMINLLYDSKTKRISYEINRQNLDNESFLYKPEILVHGGSFVDLKELYKQTNDQLRVEAAKIEEIKTQLASAQSEKDSYIVQVNELNRLIVNLEQNRRYLEQEFAELSNRVSEKDSLILLKNRELDGQAYKSERLQRTIENQLQSINEVRNSLEELNDEFIEKQKSLAEQQEKIDLQNVDISEKETLISLQQKLIFVSIALAFSMMFSLIFAYRAFKSKKKINEKLEQLVGDRTEELRISREHYRNLFESSPVAICEMNLEEMYSFLTTQSISNKDLENTIIKGGSVVTESISRIRITGLNSSMLELFDYKSKEEFETHYISTFNEKSIEEFGYNLIRFINKHTSSSYETTRKTASGKRLDLYVNWIVLPGYEDNFGKVLVTFSDITELKRHRYHLEELVRERANEIIELNENLTSTNAELNSRKEELESTINRLEETQNQLVRSEKMASLGMLTAGIAHEINNPINYISASTQAFKPMLTDLIKKLRPPSNNSKKSNQSNDEYEEISKSLQFLLANIETGIDRITEIIASLKAYYSNTGDLERKRYNIVGGIKDVLVILNSKYRDRIRINENYGIIPEILCHTSGINQVIMNIISNAIDAIPEKGTIDIETTFDKANNKILLKVKDSGIGIPQEITERIFDPFFTTKDVGKGTGLGLYIVWGVLQQHKGEVTINSEVKKGTEFIISLPVD